MRTSFTEKGKESSFFCLNGEILAELNEKEQLAGQYIYGNGLAALQIQNHTYATIRMNKGA